ncbi:hypothetical protein C8J56DRAFT_894602 [Mycena floridula]|nr:hypothetical protein C8J56DRAFT_894602 [Mycena floridula]
MRSPNELQGIFRSEHSPTLEVLVEHYNSGSDFIVALNSAQFGGGYPGPNCFETITMTYNGKTTQAKIMDESTDVGVLQGGGGGDSGDDEPKTTKKSKPTSTYHWTPTTTHTTTKKITTTSSTTTTSTKKSSTTADSTSMSKDRTSIMNGKQFQDVDSALVRMAELTLQFNMNDDDA